MNIFKKMFQPKLKKNSTSNTNDSISEQESSPTIKKPEVRMFVAPDLIRSTIIEMANQKKYKNADWDNIEADATEYLEMENVTQITKEECIKAIKKAIKKPLY